MGILEEHKQMRKITMNRTRLSNVLGDQVIPNFDEQPIKNLNFPNEKRVNSLKKLFFCKNIYFLEFIKKTKKNASRFTF